MKGRARARGSTTMSHSMLTVGWGAVGFGALADAVQSESSCRNTTPAGRDDSTTGDESKYSGVHVQVRIGSAYFTQRFRSARLRRRIVGFLAGGATAKTPGRQVGRVGRDVAVVIGKWRSLR